MKRKRLPQSERRDAIIRAVVPVFAERGFHGATTRDLAAAAGVSEALLYKHFPSKEALYDAIGHQHVEEKKLEPGAREILAMPFSTLRLIRTVEFFIRQLADSANTDFARMITRSLLQDGVFAERALSRFEQEMVPILEGSLTAARDGGDLVHGEMDANLSIWFLHHLAFGLKVFSLPQPHIVPYGRDRETVIREAMGFALRGLGLKPDVIHSYFLNPTSA